jgi:hypothetical protein
MSALETYYELRMTYYQNVMSQRNVRQCSKMYKDGRRNVHAEKLVSDDLVQSAKARK